jgi:ZIP family zinc transporter
MGANTDEIWAALAWGAASSLGLPIGAITGSFFRMSHQALAMAMSVAAGLLLAGVSLKVAADAIRIAGPVPAALALLLGATLFSASNAFLMRFGAAHRKRCGECIQQPTESQQPGSGVAIALGNALDGLPEALVLGIALRDQVVPLALVLAFSAGNFPEALSSASGMRAAGRSYGYILLVWSGIALGAAVAIAAGYGMLDSLR